MNRIQSYTQPRCIQSDATLLAEWRNHLLGVIETEFHLAHNSSCGIDNSRYNKNPVRWEVRYERRVHAMLALESYLRKRIPEFDASIEDARIRRDVGARELPNVAFPLTK